MFIPLQLTTNARGLKFITKLDPNIDRVRAWFVCNLALTYIVKGGSTCRLQGHGRKRGYYRQAYK